MATSTDPDVVGARTLAASALAASTEQTLAEPATANALRAMISSDATPDHVGAAQALLGPADNHGGRVSFLYLVPLCGILAVIFGVMWLRDRRAGGYAAERIGEADPGRGAAGASPATAG